MWGESAELDGIGRHGGLEGRPCSQSWPRGHLRRRAGLGINVPIVSRARAQRTAEESEEGCVPAGEAVQLEIMGWGRLALPCAVSRAWRPCLCRGKAQASPPWPLVVLTPQICGDPVPPVDIDTHHQGTSRSLWSQPVKLCCVGEGVVELERCQGLQRGPPFAPSHSWLTAWCQQELGPEF